MGEEVVSGATSPDLKMEEGKPHAKEPGWALDAGKGREMETPGGNSPGDTSMLAQGPTLGLHAAERRGKCVMF